MGSTESKHTTSPTTSSASSSLVDPEGELSGQTTEFGGTRVSRQPSNASTIETESTSLLLKNGNSNTNPNPDCAFESEIWEDGGVVGMGAEVSNLLKNIVGSGGLSIPGGIACFGNAPSALLPSIALIWVMGIANAYSFSLLGRICDATKSHTYSMAWERTVGRRYGRKYQLFVDSVVFGKAILGTWSFSIIIASTCTPLVRYGFDDENHLSALANGDSNNDDFSAESQSPAFVLGTITLFVLLPLCLSQRLGSLSLFSAIGTLGTCVTIATMIIRFLDGTYSEGGQFYDDLLPTQRPSFGTDKGASTFFTSMKSLTLVSILSTGFVAHYNAPKYYFELNNRTTVQFDIVVSFGFLLAAITYSVVAALGFLTFGQNSSGFILDNYSYRDPLATVARFGVAVSVIFAYPLLFHGGRDGLMALLETLFSSPNTPFVVGGDTTSGAMRTTGSYSRTESKTVTVLLLFAVTALAIYVNDLTFVLSFSGATMSSLIIYIFPPIMFSALVKNLGCGPKNNCVDREVELGYVIMIAGATLGIAGACVSVERAFF